MSELESRYPRPVIETVLGTLERDVAQDDAVHTPEGYIEKLLRLPPGDGPEASGVRVPRNPDAPMGSGHIALKATVSL